MTNARLQSSHGRSLALFFLRAAPVRAAGLISAIVAVILIAVFMVLQSFQLSGEQQADQSVGAADHSLQTGTFIPLGDSGQSTDESLKVAALQAGAANPVIQYANFDGLTIEDELATTVNFEEGDWAAEPFPRRLLMQSGRWPQLVSEVTVSSALKEDYPLGSQIELFDRNWKATVVGVVEDDFSRQASTVFAASGTWNALSAIDEPTADRYGSQASRSLYWSGGDPTAVVNAVSAVLSESDSTFTPEFLRQQLQSRSELVSRGASPLIEFSLGSLIAPFLASMVGIALANRFVNRIRAVMFSVGVARRTTRSSALLAVALSLAAGLASGIAVGVALGLGARPILDALSERAIGPIYGIPVAATGVVLASAAGGAAGVLLSSLRHASKARRSALTERAPIHYVILPVFSVLLLAGGFLAAQTALSTDQMILAGICLAFAGVLLLPLALELILLREPRSMPALLAVRRLRADIRQSGWVTSTVAALLVVAFATATLLSSAISTMNDTNQSIVPPGQIHFTPPAETPTAAADDLANEIQEYLGIQATHFYVADGGVELLDGSTVVVDDLPDFEALTDIKLSAAERKLLESGGTLRTKQPDVSEVTFESASGETHVFPASTNDGLTADYRIFDGFILRATADSNDIGLARETRAFLDGSGEQLARAQDAAIQLGFDADWLAVNETPDRFSEPIEARIAAVTISLLAVIIMTFFVLSITRLLRSNLSTLRAIGASSGWLTSVMSVQTSTVLVVAVLGAAVTAVSGIFATIRISGIDLQLTVPWQSLGSTVVTLVVGTIFASFVASRRLSNDDRFTSTD